MRGIKLNMDIIKADLDPDILDQVQKLEKSVQKAAKEAVDRFSTSVEEEFAKLMEKAEKDVALQQKLIDEAHAELKEIRQTLSDLQTSAVANAEDVKQLTENLNEATRDAIEKVEKIRSTVDGVSRFATQTTFSLVRSALKGAGIPV